MAVPALLLAAAVATWTADEGTLGALVEDHRAPIVELVIEFPVGTWSTWARSRHAEDAFVHQDDDPGHALRKRADALAVSIDLDMGRRHAALDLRFLKSDLAAALALAKDVLANTRYDEHELKRAGREKSILWRGNKTDVAFRMGQAMARRLFSTISSGSFFPVRDQYRSRKLGTTGRGNLGASPKPPFAASYD